MIMKLKQCHKRKHNTLNNIARTYISSYSSSCCSSHCDKNHPNTRLFQFMSRVSATHYFIIDRYLELRQTKVYTIPQYIYICVNIFSKQKLCFWHRGLALAASEEQSSNSNVPLKKCFVKRSQIRKPCALCFGAGWWLPASTKVSHRKKRHTYFSLIRTSLVSNSKRSIYLLTIVYNEINGMIASNYMQLFFRTRLFCYMAPRLHTFWRGMTSCKDMNSEGPEGSRRHIWSIAGTYCPCLWWIFHTRLTQGHC